MTAETATQLDRDRQRLIDTVLAERDEQLAAIIENADWDWDDGRLVEYATSTIHVDGARTIWPEQEFHAHDRRWSAKLVGTDPIEQTAKFEITVKP